MAAPHTKIPDDIIYAVVSHVDANETPTLRSCNATSKAFRLIAQRRLFNSINVVINGSRNQRMARLQHLREIFLKSPTAALMVKQLHLGFEGGSPGGTPTSLLLLDMMPNIEQLSMKNIETWEGRYCMQIPSWRILDFGLRKAIEKLLRRDSLRHLDIYEIHDFPLKVLRVCRPNVQILNINLKLGRPGEKEEFVADEGSWALGTAKPSLEHCGIMGDTGCHLNPVMKSLLQYPLSLVNNLTIRCNQGRDLDANLIQQLVDCVSLNLKTFSIVVGDNLGIINLAQAHRLSELTLGRFCYPTSEAITWILQVMNTIQQTQTLNALTLQIGMVDMGDSNLVELNNELTTSAKFNGCSIRVFMGSRRGENLEDILVTYMWDLVQRPDTSIYNKQNLLDLEALRARVENDLD